MEDYIEDTTWKLLRDIINELRAIQEKKPITRKSIARIPIKTAKGKLI